jgi:hypothetical protein
LSYSRRHRHRRKSCGGMNTEPGTPVRFARVGFNGLCWERACHTFS